MHVNTIFCVYTQPIIFCHKIQKLLKSNAKLYLFLRLKFVFAQIIPQSILKWHKRSVEQSNMIFLFSPMVSWRIVSLKDNQCSSSLLNRVRDKFFAMVDSGMKNWDDRESRDILRSILMTTCDVAAITKPWEIQRKVGFSFVCISRFFCQPYF